MKKFLLMTLSCLLCACLSAPALANGWGLKGSIYGIVSDTDRYDGYQAMADTGDRDWQWAAGCTVDFAVLENRYHTVLIAASEQEGGAWDTDVVSTAAVYQPGQTEERLELVPDDVGVLTIKYGSDHYDFTYDEETGKYYLSEAYYGDTDRYSDVFRSSSAGMQFWSAGPSDTFLPVGDAMWLNDGITLEEFNITRMPRSLADIRRMNRTGQILTAYGPEWAVRSVHKGEKNGRTLAVYSAPDITAWRAAKGKASVSLDDKVDIIGTFGGWTLIQYEVSSRTSRIGYVEGELAENAELTFADIPLVAEVDTFLTDDPFVSQYEQMTIPAGTEVTGLCKAGEYYAYVETSLDGQLIRGFVPLKDLMTKYDRVLTTGTDLLSADVRWDVMEGLVGKWYTGEDYANKLILFADGGYLSQDGYHAWAGKDPYAPEGNYRVYSAEGGDGSIYVMKFFTEDNVITTFTLRLNEDASVTLTDEAGQETVYRRDEYSTYGNG